MQTPSGWTTAFLDWAVTPSRPCRYPQALGLFNLSFPLAISSRRKPLRKLLGLQKLPVRRARWLFIRREPTRLFHWDLCSSCTSSSSRLGDATSTSRVFLFFGRVGSHLNSASRPQKPWFSDIRCSGPASEEGQMANGTNIYRITWSHRYP